MADKLITELEIDNKVLGYLDSIDDKLARIEEQSESISKAFSASMNNMERSTSGLSNVLSDVSNTLKSISKTKIDISGSNKLGETATDAEKLANAINGACVALSALYSEMRSNGKDARILSDGGASVDKEALNERRRTNNELIEQGRQITQLNKENALEAKRLANATKEASMEEDLRSKRAQSRIGAEIGALNQQNALYDRYVKALSMSEAGEKSRIKKIERLKSLMDELYNSSEDYSKEIDVLSKKINSLTKENERLAKAEEKMSKTQLDLRRNEKAIDAYNRAMMSSEATLSQVINKKAKLKQVEEMLVKTGRDYRTEIEKIHSEIKRLTSSEHELASQVKKSHRGLLDTSGQLARSLALVFSVSQIRGYIGNVIRVTGEFEKQNVALASILQNKDKADKLFGQITELAVKSPFQLKELVTYTKQLSAYKVEYEDLFDTTRRLADVSSGLGVDMQRLILAFGQVKAANYLRGTEVRQFTEAGINILGELAKKYSALEGRIVSVGEVQERVTKRMVAFGDVEDVFKRLTDAGGAFYKMQERQAETVAGIRSNLEDSLDIMRNDIGKANIDSIKSSYETLISLIKNWREVAWYVQKAVVAISAWKGASALASVGNMKLFKSLFKVKEMTADAEKKLTIFQKTLRGVGSVGRGVVGVAGVALIAFLVDLIRQATRASREMKALRKEINNIANEGEASFSRDVSGLDDLITRMKLAKQGSSDMREAISSLNSNYGEYLDNIVTEKTSLDELVESYDKVVERMRNASDLKTFQKALQAIDKTYTDAMNDLKESIGNISIGLFTGDEKELFKKRSYIIPSKEEIESILGVLQSEVDKAFKEGIDLNREKAYEMLNSVLKKYYDVEEVSFKGGIAQEKYLEYIDLIIDKKKEEIELEETLNSKRSRPYDTKALNDEYKALKVKHDGLVRDINALENTSEYQKKKKLNDERKRFELEVVDFEKRSNLISPEVAKERTDAINYINKSISYVNKKINDALKGYSEKELNLVLLGGEEEEFADFKGIIDSTRGSLESWNEQVELNNQLTKKGIPLKEEDVKYAIRMRDAFKKRAEILGIDLNKKTRKKDPELEELKEKIRLLKEVLSAYNELAKRKSGAEALKDIKDIYKESSIGSIVESMSEIGEEQIISAMRTLLNTAGEEGNKEIEKAIRPLEKKRIVNVDASGIDKIKGEIESLFSSYQFNLNLESSNIDPSELRKLLASEGIDDTTLSLIGFSEKTLGQTIDDIKKKIGELRATGGKESIEEADKLQKKLTSIMLSEAQKRLSELSSLRDKYWSVEEKKQLHQNKLEEYNNKLKEEGLSKQDEEYYKYKAKDEQQAIDDLNDEAIKLTDFWKQLFGNLDELSTNTLVRLMEQSDEIINNATKKKGTKGTYESFYVDKDNQRHNVEITEAMFQQIKVRSNKVAKEVKKNNPFRALFESVAKGRREEESKADYISRLEGNIKGATSASFELADGLMSIAGASEADMEKLEGIKNVTEGAADAGIGMAKMFSGDVLGGAMQAVGGILKAKNAIDKMFDARRERKIQEQQKKIENLQEAYEKLEEAIDKAFDAETLKETSAEMNRSLYQQNVALSKSIKLEEEKKQTDKKRVKEWRKQIEENRKMIEENNKKLIQSFGGLGTDDAIKSAAEEFASAWLDSFMEVGEGLQGLEDTMHGWMENAIKKQLLTSLSKKFVTPILENFDAMFADGEMTSKEVESFKDLFDKNSALFDEKAKAYLEMLNQSGIVTDMGQMETEGLQKGIQSVTEQTAQALEALLSSMRLYVSDSNAQLKQILLAINNPTVENPYIAEMRLQTEQLRMMNALWNSLSSTKQGVQGRVLKVQMM